MTVYISPVFGAGAQLLDNQGRVLALGTINTYQAGTSTPLATYTDSTGGTPNNVSIPLDSAGRPPAEIWLTGGQAYKFIVKDSTGATVGVAYDNISGVNDPGAAASGSLQAWNSVAGTPTFISATQFSMTGDQRTTFPIGTRVKSTNTSGTVYSTVSAVAFGSFTTITVVNDSTTLDSGLSAVSVSTSPTVGMNVSANAVAYQSSLTYQGGSLGLAVQNAVSAGTTNTTNIAGATKAPTTGGTSTAYTLTPVPAIASYVTGQTWLAELHTTPGASPTINISGQGAKNLKQLNTAGTKVAFSGGVTGQIVLLGYDGTDVMVITPLPVNSGYLVDSGSALGSVPVGGLMTGQGSGAALTTATLATLAFNGSDYITNRDFAGTFTAIQYGTWRSLGSVNSSYGLWERIS